MPVDPYLLIKEYILGDFHEHSKNYKKPIFPSPRRSQTTIYHSFCYGNLWYVHPYDRT